MFTKFFHIFGNKKVKIENRKELVSIDSQYISEQYLHNNENELIEEIKGYFIETNQENNWLFLFELLRYISSEILLDTYEEIKLLANFHTNEIAYSEKEILKNTISMACIENSISTNQFGKLAELLLNHKYLSEEQFNKGIKYVENILNNEFDIDEEKEFLEKFKLEKLIVKSK